MPASEVFKKFKSGKLHSGSKHGPVVTNPKQAVAIEISEKQNEAEHGGHYVSGGDRRNPLEGSRRRRGK